MPFIPAIMGPPGWPATGTTGDSRRGAATAAAGLYGVSRVLFSGRGCGSVLPVLPGLAPSPVRWRIERQEVVKTK